MRVGHSTGRTKLSTTIGRAAFDFLRGEVHRTGRPVGRVMDEIVQAYQSRRTEDELARGYELLSRENHDFAELTLAAQREVLEPRGASKKGRAVLGRLQSRARK